MLTLAQYKVGLRDKLDQMIVDEFRRDSVLLDRLMFDDAVAMNGSGSTLSYGYLKLKTPSGAGARPINSEYTPNDALREEETTHLIIMGGSYELDRVIQKTSGAIDEVQFQTKDKIRATANFFHYMALNGVETQDLTTGSYTAFNGLSKLLEGASTEMQSQLDISTWDDSDKNYFALIDEIEEMISGMSVKPDALLMNAKMRLKLISAARRAGYLTSSEDAFGRKVSAYDGILLLDMGEYYDKANATSKLAIPITNGATDLFAVSFDRDGFIGVSATGGAALIESRLPDFSNAKAVQTGSVEMLAGVALKNTKKAAVLRGIQIQASSNNAGGGGSGGGSDNGGSGGSGGEGGTT